MHLYRVSLSGHEHELNNYYACVYKSANDTQERAKKLTITFHIFLFFAVVLGSGIVDVNIDPVLGYNGGVGFGIAHGVDEHELLWIDLRLWFGLGLLWFG